MIAGCGAPNGTNVHRNWKAEVSLLIAWPMFQDKACFLIFLDKPYHCGERSTKETFDFRARAIVRTNPNKFGRRSQENTSLLKVGIFRNDGETIYLGILPNRRVVRATQSALMNMGRTRKKIGQQIHQQRRKVFVEEKLHAPSVSSLRSRSAANERHARISWSVK